MFEARVHGRGGQGVVTAAELLSVAAFREGRHAQAFPTFGSERTGAPVTAFRPIADEPSGAGRPGAPATAFGGIAGEPIRAREPIVEPDAVVVQDPTLLRQVDVFGG